jgi:hypothetical protein
MMLKTHTAIWMVVGTMGVPGVAAAQQAAPAEQPAARAAATQRPVDRTQLRRQIHVMEGALAKAVEFGAQSLNREIRAVMPDMMVLAGQAQARGVYLDGYGIFFDVEVPVLRQSMMWSVQRMLDNDQAGLQTALSQMRQLIAKEIDPARRASFENALNRVELQNRPSLFTPPQSADGLGRTVSGNVLTSDAPQAPAAAEEQPGSRIPTDKLWVKDPNRAYTEAVQRAIVDAMIDYSGPMMRVRPDEWLTVAARDNLPREGLAPPDPLDEVVTVLLQIKGSDLAEYSAGRIDSDELRRRVIVREF